MTRADCHLRSHMKEIAGTGGEGFRPRMECEEGTIYFADAKKISHEEWKTGIGHGILSHFEGFELNGADAGIAFDTIVWIEEVSGDVFFEWVPLSTETVKVKSVYWPGYMEFDEKKDSWYTLLNWQQGLLVPNTWKTAVDKVVFDGLWELQVHICHGLDR